MIYFRKFILSLAKVNNYVLFISTAILVFGASWLVVLVERETFPTWFDGFWWVMTTVTTVGYGDYYPSSVMGRLIAIFLYIVGIGLIGVVIGKIIDSLTVFRKKQMEGDIVFRGSDHFVIVGWSNKTRFAIKEILETDSRAEIVLIDEVKEAPMLTDQVYYIRGDAASEETLKKANITAARAVLIFAGDEEATHAMRDGKSLLIASSIEALAPHAHTIVEVMEEKHMANFKHVKVDEFIVSNEMISTLAVRSAFRRGISDIYSQLLHSDGEDLYYVTPWPEWKTYRDAFHDLLDEGATLLADRNDLAINRKLDQPIPPEAELHVVCDAATYQTILQKGERK